MSGFLRKVFGLELHRNDKARQSVRESPEHRAEKKTRREQRQEDAMRRWDYDLRRIQQAVREVESGKPTAQALADLNADPLFSKPITSAMFARLIEKHGEIDR